MNFRGIIKSFAVAALFVLGSQASHAQDLLANQAPIDRRASKVDTMVFNRLRTRENLQNPSSDLYDSWNTNRAHVVTPLPAEYRIDLRGFHMPTPSRVVTSNFGRRWGRAHQGLDIKVYIGDTIRAAWSGKVRVVKYDAGGYGNYVVIRHNNGLETIYGHMSKQLVNTNQIVKAGQPIGLGGNTGRSTGSHLHFETRLCGHALNPALFFDFPNQDVIGDSYVFRSGTNQAESDRATALRGKAASPGYSKENIQGTRDMQKSAPRFEEKAPETSEPHAQRTYNSNNDIIYHKVQQGETLESIAEKYGISVSQLCRINGIGRYSRLSEGQLLKYKAG